VISHSLTGLISAFSSVYRAHQPVCQADKKKHPSASRQTLTQIRTSEIDSIRHGENKAEIVLLSGRGGYICNHRTLNEEIVL